MTLEPIIKLGGKWLDAEAAARRGLFLSNREEGGVRRVALENRSGAIARPEELGWRKAPERGDFDVPGLKFYVESWQMASPCGVRAWNDEPFDYSPDYLPNCVSTPGDFHPGERGRFLSDNACCLRRPDGAMRLFGFTTGTDRFGHFDVKLGPDGVEVFLALCACDCAELPDGGCIETESLLVLDGRDTEALFAAYADRWAADSGARRRFAAPVGWCSWYYYFKNISLADVLENADWLAAHRGDKDFGKVNVIQLDAGYQTADGDWLSTTEKFPGGVGRFAQELRRRGFTPGLWVAPFRVEEGSRLYAEHPDWVIRDAAGTPFPCHGTGRDRRIFVLDATRTEVLDHLESLFREIRSLGIDYVKLDFCMVECAGTAGLFHDRAATRAQALRRGFEAIRRGFGDDGFILACTTPFAPVVGIADAMRSSTDITPYWERKGVHQFAEAPNVPNVCRNVIHHAYLNGRLWVNDPDTLIVRDDNTELTGDEVGLWERAISFAGGSLMLSDRMAALSPERLALARRALADAGRYRNAIPVDRWEQTLPAVWEAEREGRRIRAVFDFDKAHTVSEEAAEAPHPIKPSTAPDRVRSPLRVDLERVGTLRPRGAREIGPSNWTIGCEVLDRDFADFREYRHLVEPLGIRTVRLQAGWAKCERTPGVFCFAWLDDIIDFLKGKGLDVILETSYGNPIYPGAGGWDLSGGIPTSEEGLAAWDRWIDALSKRYAGRVDFWAMWNEPDNNREVNTPEKVAAFNRRTALAIRRNIPDARLQGLSLGGNDPEYFEACLKALAATDDVDLFETYIYHGYELAPEMSYPLVEAKKAILAKYSSKARLRQGENGCPSEMIDFFALWNNPWTELSQAKWDMRRMLGDLGHGVESSVYTMSDFRHNGAEIHSPNNKGLVRANADRKTIAVKRAYYAVQNVAGLFDGTVERDLTGRATCTDITLSFYAYSKRVGDGSPHPLFVFWRHGHIAEKRDWTTVKPADLVFDRPGDSCETRPMVFEWQGPPFENPVWVDLLTGRVYAFPAERQLVHTCGVTFIDVPVYDSPCVLAERAAIIWNPLG